MIRLGTRGSALALAQSRTVADAITAVTGRRVELVEIATAGDRSSAPVVRLGVGVFVSALRDALLAKEIDLAVHSYKDLPTAPAEGLQISAVPPRNDPRDALVSRNRLPLRELAPGARVGTGAPRRVAQLRALGLPLELVAVRGNVDTRLRRVAEGDLDGVVVALAGLARLGRAEEITEILDPALVLPAPAQGALAVECRADDTDLVEATAGIDHRATRVAVTAERALLSTLEAGCSAPVAGLADVLQRGGAEVIALQGAVISPDGAVAIRRTRCLPLPVGEQAEVIARRGGTELAGELLAAGADTILNNTSQDNTRGVGKPTGTGPARSVGSSQA